MNTSVKIQLDKGAFMPERAHATDAGADIKTPHPFTMLPHMSRTIKTGVHIETPPGHATMVKSKSGLYVKYGITTTGVVDEGYTGEVLVRLKNNGPDTISFEKGDKIAQLVIVPVMYADFEQVDEIGGGDRGNGGFGSTGR